MRMKRGIPVWMALFMAAAALFARLLLPDLTEQARAVFFAEDALDRIVEVFAPDVS